MADNWFKTHITAPIITMLGSRKYRKNFSHPPVFIFGCGRSGTTLLLSILSAHPHIFALSRESAAFRKWAERLNKGKRFKVPQRLDRFYLQFLLSRIPEEAKRICAKEPNKVHFIGQILGYFDYQVKLIHIIRDGRDVMLSRHPKYPSKYWIDPERWVTDVKAGLAFKGHPNVLTIYYEDLIGDYLTTIQTICDFIEEPCVDEVYNWVQHTQVTQSAAWESGVQDVHSRSLKKWQSTSDQGRVREIMANEEVAQLLAQLGYSV